MTERPSLRLDTALPLVTGVAALSYFVGFLVANGYYGGLQLLELEAFRLHYLVAAMLFAFTTAVPVAAVTIMNAKFTAHWSGSEATSRPWRRLYIAVAYWIFLALGVMIAWGVVMNVISVGGFGAWWRESLAYLIAVFLVTWLVHHVRTRIIPSGILSFLRRSDMSDLHQLVIAGTAIVSFAAAYGSLVYPYVRPQYGGGAAWVVDLAHGDGLSTSVPRASSRVAVISRDDTSLRFVACSEYDDARHVSLLDISRRDINILRLIRVEAVSTSDTDVPLLSGEMSHWG